jgi:hypothetical protein
LPFAADVRNRRRSPSAKGRGLRCQWSLPMARDRLIIAAPRGGDWGHLLGRHLHQSCSVPITRALRSSKWSISAMISALVLRICHAAGGMGKLEPLVEPPLQHDRKKPPGHRVGLCSLPNSAAITVGLKSTSRREPKAIRLRSFEGFSAWRPTQWSLLPLCPSTDRARHRCRAWPFVTSCYSISSVFVAMVDAPRTVSHTRK